MVKIGSYLLDQYQKQLIDLLKENLDVFTWSHVDMSGIPPFTSCHKLNVNPHHKTIKQNVKLLMRNVMIPLNKKWTAY